MALPAATSSAHEIDIPQATKACRVLLKNIAEQKQQRASSTGKKDLLAGDGSDNDDTNEENDTPVWMVVTTKKHITDQTRLKPKKIPVPHPLNTTSSATICLITSDPQRLYKDTVADPEFPKEISSRITRVIGLQKLKAKYKSYEARRSLAAEYDIFLADDRIVTYLPAILGKVFFKGTTKRPIPISIAGPSDKNSEGKRLKHVPGAKKKSVPNQEGQGVAPPARVAAEILKALRSVTVHLSPSATTSVKVARAAFKPEMIAKNIETVIESMTNGIIPQGWKNLRAVHIKGPETAAFPIWLASELWADDEDVLEEKKIMGKKGRRSAQADEEGQAIEGGAEGSALKRKAGETSRPTASRHAKKKRKAEVDPDDASAAADAAVEAAARKQQRKQNKAAAMVAAAS